MPTFELTYFDAPGRAEPIRLALRMAGLPFEDHRISFGEFSRMKADDALPLGQVPMLAVDGTPLVQTGAILRYVARLSGGRLYPSDPFRALLVDSALDTVNDTLSHALMPSLFERDASKKLAMRAAWVEGPMTRGFRYLEGLLEAHGGPMFGGDAVSVGDLVVAHQIGQIQRGTLDGVGVDVLAPYPRLVAATEAVAADPEVVKAMGG